MPTTTSDDGFTTGDGAVEGEKTFYPIDLSLELDDLLKALGTSVSGVAASSDLIEERPNKELFFGIDLLGWELGATLYSHGYFRAGMELEYDFGSFGGAASVTVDRPGFATGPMLLTDESVSFDTTIFFEAPEPGSNRIWIGTDGYMNAGIRVGGADLGFNVDLDKTLYEKVFTPGDPAVVDLDYVRGYIGVPERPNLVLSGSGRQLDAVTGDGPLFAGLTLDVDRLLTPVPIPVKLQDSYFVVRSDPIDIGIDYTILGLALDVSTRVRETISYEVTGATVNVSVDVLGSSITGKGKGDYFDSFEMGDEFSIVFPEGDNTVRITEVWYVRGDVRDQIELVLEGGLTIGALSVSGFINPYAIPELRAGFTVLPDTRFGLELGSVEIWDETISIDFTPVTVTYDVVTSVKILATEGNDGPKTMASIDTDFDALGGNDGITGNVKANRMWGAGGDDTLNGGAGNDSLYGGEGVDYLRGGLGDDFVQDTSPVGNGTLLGEAGDDRLEGGAGTKTANGGDGNDAVVIALRASGAQAIYGDELGGPDGFDQVLIDGSALTKSVNWVISETGETTLVAAAKSNLGIVTAQRSFMTGFEKFNMVAGSGDDTIVGTANSDQFNGSEGRDSLEGGAGGDVLFGGFGEFADTLRGGFGRDYLFGDGGGDSLDGGADDDTISGGAGGDRVLGGSGLDEIAGDGGDDTLDGGLGDDTVEGGDGSDVISGAGYQDSLAGGAGADRIIYRLSSELSAAGLFGGELDDETPGEGGDTLEAGYAPGALVFTPVVFDVDDPSLIDGAVHWGFEHFHMTGALGDDFLEGADGNDTLIGAGGNDELFGGAGRNSLSGGSGDDYVQGTLGDSLDGGLGTDLLELIVYGPAGPISVSLQEAARQSGRSTPTTATNFEALFLQAGGFDDSVIGGSGGDLLRLEDGDDFARTDDGNDTVYGGFGADTVSTGAGDDLIGGIDSGDLRHTGPGRPVIRGDVYDAGAGNDVIVASYTALRVDGSEGDDVITQYSQGLREGGAPTLNGGQGADTIDGGTRADYIVGGLNADPDPRSGVGRQFGTAIDGADRLAGDGGNDTILGGLGADTLAGGTGNDTLLGEKGADRLDAGTGADSVDGGSGDDFIFTDAETGRSGTRDFLLGGTGNDTVEAGHVADMDGGAGLADVLVLRPGTRYADVVLDFRAPRGAVGAVDTLPDGSTVRGFEQLRFFGSATSDALTVDYGSHALNGGSGVDRVTIDMRDYGEAASAVWVTIKTVRTLLFDNGMTVQNFEQITVLEGPAGFTVSGAAPSGVTMTVTPTTAALGSSNPEYFGGGAEADTYSGRGGGDQIDGEVGNDWLLGGDGDDTVESGPGLDRINGNAGVDVLAGGDGNDALDGGAGADSLYGGAGRDRLDGGPGADVDWLFGGADADRDIFVLRSGAGVDRIYEFTSRQDGLQLVGFEFEDGLAYVVDGALAAGQRGLLFDTTSRLLSYDPDGAGGEAAVVLAYVDAVTPAFADFVL